MSKSTMPRGKHVDHCLRIFKEFAAKLPEGEVAECGVALGNTTFELDPLVLAARKKLYAFDTFEGLPYDDAIAGERQCKRGEMNYGEEFFAKLSQLEKTSIVPVRGLVEETLAEFHDKTFSFVWLDMDLHLPTSFAYNFFANRMVLGGVIGFHDYGFSRCPGIKLVVDGEVDKGKYETILHRDWCYFVRRVA